jgi:adenine deaminase
MLTADGPEAATIARDGYLDHVIRQAIAAGIEPVVAYQMATVAPATYVGLDEDLGGIAPGRRADIVVLDDLREPRPSSVCAAGRVAAEDVVRLALLDPQGRWIVRGALGNFVRRIGGLASTFNVAAHLIVLGQNTADMARAAHRVLELGGGIVAVDGGRTALEVPLPIGGIMAPDSFRAVAERAAALYAFLRARGYPHTDPHYTLLFLTLDSLPDLRLTYRGVWDVRRGRTLVPRTDL